MEDHCETKVTELLHICQISSAESQLKSFRCVFKFEDEKVESRELWPEIVTVSRFYRNESARLWHKKTLKKYD